jgi:ribonuclease E
MKDPRHRTSVEKAVREHTKLDKARIRTGRISQFGLMEMSRQRIRPSIEFGSYIQCLHCRGKGVVPSPETLAIGFLRRLRLEARKEGIEKIEGVVPVSVADYLLNKKRKELTDLETRSNVTITVRGEQGLAPGESRIHCENRT